MDWDAGETVSIIVPKGIFQGECFFLKHMDNLNICCGGILDASGTQNRGVG